MTEPKPVTSANDSSRPARPAATERSSTSRPGVLRGNVTLILQTSAAQALLQGREKSDARSGIVGLFAFASATRILWQAAEQGDPYATWWLAKIERALDEASAALAQIATTLHSVLSKSSGFQVVTAESIAPCATPLQFSTAHAFRGARLLAEYDDVVRRVLSARHTSLVSPQESRVVLYEAGRAVRRAFATVIGFVATGIRWDDLRAANPRLAYAAQKMGPLPAAIRAGVERPRALPKRRTLPTLEWANTPGVEAAPGAVMFEDANAAGDVAPTAWTADCSDLRELEVSPGREPCAIE